MFIWVHRGVAMENSVTGLYEWIPQIAAPGIPTSKLRLDFETVIHHGLANPPTPPTALAVASPVDSIAGILRDDGPVHLV